MSTAKDPRGSAPSGLSNRPGSIGRLRREDDRRPGRGSYQGRAAGRRSDASSRPFPNDKPDPEERGVTSPTPSGRHGRPWQARGTRVARPPARKADILIHNVPPYERANQGSTARRCARVSGVIVASISMYATAARAPLARLRAERLERRRLGVSQPGASPYPEIATTQALRRAVRFQGGAHAALTSLAAMR